MKANINETDSLMLIVSSGPHVMTIDTIPKIMWSVVLALVPAMCVAYANFGWYSLLVVGVSVVGALLTETVILYFRSPASLPRIFDGSAVVTGILLAFTLPPNVPLYVPAVGSIFAIGIAKHAFGGLGCNIWNPALAARAFLLAAYSSIIVMPQWPMLKNFETISSATPCAILKTAPLTIFEHYSLFDLFVGHRPGCIGEVSVLALLLGGIYLMIRGYVNWRLPLAFIGTVAALVFLMPVAGTDGVSIGFWETSAWSGVAPIYMRVLAHIFSGGLILGAFFMATDMVTSPLTDLGQAIFGIGCGLIVVLIRYYGGYPEGVCYSILIMNTFVWLIDKYTKPRLVGERICTT